MGAYANPRKPEAYPGDRPPSAPQPSYAAVAYRVVKVAEARSHHDAARVRVELLAVADEATRLAGQDDEVLVPTLLGHRIQVAIEADRTPRAGS
jgi:hypothetical protein